MNKRKFRLIVLMAVQVVALFFMIFRGLQRPWQVMVAGGLVVGTGVTCVVYYSPPKQQPSSSTSSDTSDDRRS